ncbi:hypothetical protein LCGC14_2008260, partial [marine sediment metagenome]
LRYGLKGFDIYITNLFFNNYVKYFSDEHGLNFLVQDLESGSRSRPNYVRRFAEKGTLEYKAEFFVDSSINLVSRLSRIIQKLDLRKYGSEASSILRKLLTVLYLEGTSATDAGRGSEINIRYQVEKFLLSDKSHDEITFSKVMVDNSPFILNLKREQLLGIDIKYFGSLSRSPFASLIKPRLVNRLITMAKVKELSSIIKENGEKVRLYTTIGIDKGSSGIQYIKPDAAGEHFIYLDRTSSQSEPHYYEVDFSKGELQALRILEKVVSLSMSYSIPNFFKDFLFIMKGVDENGDYYDYTHTGMICAFNGQRFFTDNELFSQERYEPIGSPDYEYYQVTINSMEGVFNLEDANIGWLEYTFYIPYNVDRGELDGPFSGENSYYK